MQAFLYWENRGHHRLARFQQCTSNTPCAYKNTHNRTLTKQTHTHTYTRTWGGSAGAWGRAAAATASAMADVEGGVGVSMTVTARSALCGTCNGRNLQKKVTPS